MKINEINLCIRFILSRFIPKAFNKTTSCLGSILVLLIITTSFSSAQTNVAVMLPKDTLKLTLAQAEELFIKKNLQLLNQKYNIDEAQASVIQARIWDNPNFSISQGIYNPDDKKYFELPPNGEIAGGIDQLIVIAGKRNKRVQIAKLNEKINEYQYFDLIRTLKYSLESTFTDLYYNRQSLAVYDVEINSLQKIIDVYTDQEQKGNVALKDLIRIKAQLFSLENEKMGIQYQINSNEHDLNVLIMNSDSSKIVPVLNNNDIHNIRINITYPQLKDSLVKNRYDLKAADANIALNNMNVQLQKKIAIPDLDIGFSYDYQGSYVIGYNALTLGLTLPVWDQNHQQVKIAQYQTEQAKLNYNQSLYLAYNDMLTAYEQAIESENLFRKFDASLPDQLKNLNHSVVENFEKKNIGLLEFLDYYDAYKTNIVQVNQLEDNRLKALENLNFVAGSNIFKL